MTHGSRINAGLTISPPILPTAVSRTLAIRAASGALWWGRGVKAVLQHSLQLQVLRHGRLRSSLQGLSQLRENGRLEPGDGPLEQLIRRQIRLGLSLGAEKRRRRGGLSQYLSSNRALSPTCFPLLLLK